MEASAIYGSIDNINSDLPTGNDDPIMIFEPGRLPDGDAGSSY